MLNCRFKQSGYFFQAAGFQSISSPKPGVDILLFILLSRATSFLGEDKSTTQVPLPPMRVCALRTSIIDPDIHVILIDPEALIRQLLTEEAQFFASKASPINAKRGMANPNIMDKRYNTNTVSYEIAQLLLSCIHAWGLDITLDSTCISKLGMLKPLNPVSFGLLTRGRLALMFPDWYVSGEEEIIAGALEAEEQPEKVSGIDLFAVLINKVRVCISGNVQIKRFLNMVGPSHGKNLLNFLIRTIIHAQ